MRSEYAAQFKESAYCYCSMDKKPLKAYSALDYRNRNAIPDLSMPYKNASIVEFDHGMHHRKDRSFATTNQLAYRGEPVDDRKNQGTFSRVVKYKHHLQVK